MLRGRLRHVGGRRLGVSDDNRTALLVARADGALQEYRRLLSRRSNGDHRRGRRGRPSAAAEVAQDGTAQVRAAGMRVAVVGAACEPCAGGEHDHGWGRIARRGDEWGRVTTGHGWGHIAMAGDISPWAATCHHGWDISQWMGTHLHGWGCVTNMDMLQ